MGCCQGKDFQTSDEPAKEAELEEVEGGIQDTPRGPRERGKGQPRDRPGGCTGEGRAELSGFVIPAGFEGVDEDPQDRRHQRSNESLLITVLFRRLSLLSRRGSNKRQSAQSQKQGLQESNREAILEEPEKG